MPSSAETIVIVTIVAITLLAGRLGSLGDALGAKLTGWFRPRE